MDHVGPGPVALAEKLLDLARLSGARLCTAESCTAGLLAGAITEVAGASDIFEYGLVTYSNAAKRSLLGVRQQTLEKFGAVSQEVAREMALGALNGPGLGATHAVSLTGIAGPGGSQHKPEGRVCFALATARGARSETVEFGALGRGRVRAAAVSHGLRLFIEALS